MPDPLDPELVEGISLAKKKPLSFALIAKGTEPVKLIIQKKVIKEGAIAKAKSTYKGNLVISGVCIGSGAQLEFQVVGEASDEPSIKTKKIKDFIAEQAGVTIMPSWKCVPALPNVEDDEAAPSPATESQTPPPAPPVPPAAGGEAKSLMAMLAKLSTTIQGAVAAHPQRRNEIVGFVGSFKKEVEAEQFEPAKKTLKSLMTLLKELGVALPGAAPTAPQPTASQPAAPQPTPTPAQESPPATPTRTPPSALAKSWQQEYDALEKDYAEALKKADSKLKSQLVAVYAFFAAPASFENEDEPPKTEQEKDKAYERALKALDKLKPLVAQALAVQGPGGASQEIAKGIVKKRQFLLQRWSAIPGEITADLRSLKEEMVDQNADEDPDELMEAIEKRLSQFYGDMKDALDDSINSGDGNYVKTIDAIKSFKTEIQADPLIQHLQKNPLTGDVSVESILIGALDEVEQNLAS